MRRGRPKKNTPKQDFGTPELQQKRRYGLTREPLDSLLDSGIISIASHQAGLHLRWLYSLVHGIPAPASAFCRLLDTKSNRQDNLHWRERRERDYVQLTQRLQKQQKHLRLLFACCVHGEMPEAAPEAITQAFKLLETEMQKLNRT